MRFSIVILAGVFVMYTLLVSLFVKKWSSEVQSSSEVLSIPTLTKLQLPPIVLPSMSTSVPKAPKHRATPHVDVECQIETKKENQPQQKEEEEEEEEGEEDTTPHISTRDIPMFTSRDSLLEN
jgi:hypothetical protein